MTGVQTCALPDLATLEAKPDIQRIMGLDTKRKVLKARIDEVQKQFALHHGAEI